MIVKMNKQQQKCAHYSTITKLQKQLHVFVVLCNKLQNQQHKYACYFCCHQTIKKLNLLSKTIKIISIFVLLFLLFKTIRAISIFTILKSKNSCCFYYSKVQKQLLFLLFKLQKQQQFLLFKTIETTSISVVLRIKLQKQLYVSVFFYIKVQKELPFSIGLSIKL